MPNVTDSVRTVLQVVSSGCRNFGFTARCQLHQPQQGVRHVLWISAFVGVGAPTPPPPGPLATRNICNCKVNVVSH